MIEWILQSRIHHNYDKGKSFVTEGITSSSKLQGLTQEKKVQRALVIFICNREEIVPDVGSHAKLNHIYRDRYHHLTRVAIEGRNQFHFNASLKQSVKPCVMKRLNDKQIDLEQLDKLAVKLNIFVSREQ